jgi:hypothetical protein
MKTVYVLYQVRTETAHMNISLDSTDLNATVREAM